MPWCPKCKSEYREGFTHCSDCDSELIEDNLQAKEKFSEEHIEWVFLKNFSESETYIIEPLLEEEGIPVLKRRREVGGYLKVSAGMSIFGVDLYVPSEGLNRAKELIKEQATGEFSEYNEKEKEIVEDNAHCKGRNKNIWVILVAFFLPLLAWIIVELIGV